MLVGTLDNPLYETYLTSTKSAPSTVMSVPPSSSAASPATSFSIFGVPGASPNPAAAAEGSNVGYGHKNSVSGRHVMQLVAHASLDVVEDVQWTNGGMSVQTNVASVKFARLTLVSLARYLKSIDKFHEWTVSVWLTPGGECFASMRAHGS